MTASEVAMLLIIFILLIILIVLLALNIKTKKKINNLKSSIDDYFKTGKKSEFSTEDNNFSFLQNSVCDLECALEVQKRNSEQIGRKNSEFISDISHQLKTPIAGLRLYVEMDNSLNPCDHTKKELALVEKMETLIGRLLYLEKIKTDTYKMNFTIENIGEIINSLICDFKPIFPQKQIYLTGDSKLRCDKQWISEAIGNVLKNACEHTEDDGIIKIEIDDTEKSTIVFIEDNGKGVPPEELCKLFQRFHQISNKKSQGVGIGLAITKAIVEKHHGTVSAENTDEGLKITMCFPHIDGYLSI